MSNEERIHYLEDSHKKALEAAVKGIVDGIRVQESLSNEKVSDNVKLLAACEATLEKIMEKRSEFILAAAYAFAKNVIYNTEIELLKSKSQDKKDEN